MELTLEEGGESPPPLQDNREDVARRPQWVEVGDLKAAMEEDPSRVVDVFQKSDWPRVEKALRKLPPLGTEVVDLASPYEKQQLQEARTRGVLHRQPGFAGHLRLPWVDPRIPDEGLSEEGIGNPALERIRAVSEGVKLVV